MANKKIGVVTNDNVDFFIGYISSSNRLNKISREIVEQLTQLAHEASRTAINRQIDFAIQHDIESAMLIHTWTDDQRTLIECAHIVCYQALNDFVDALNVTDYDLRKSFRNADNQRKYKLANKKHNFEVREATFYELKRLRALCAECDIELFDALRNTNRQLSQQIKNKEI